MQRITVGGQYSNGWAGHDVAVFWSRPFSNQQSIFPVLRLFLEKCPKEMLDTNSFIHVKFNLVCYTSVHKFQSTSLWDGWLCLWCKNWPWKKLHNSMQFASGVTDALLQLSWKAQFWMFGQILQETRQQ